MAKLAKDIGDYKSRRWLKFYSTFTFRVSAQRCSDSSDFIRNAPLENKFLSKASELRMKQAQLYARCQSLGAMMKFGKVAEILLEISELEDEFEVELQRGLLEV